MKHISPPIPQTKKLQTILTASTIALSSILLIPNITYAQNNQADNSNLVTIDVTDELKLEFELYFDTNSTQPNKNDLPNIATIQQQMRNFPNATISIEGFSSADEQNKQNLSEARANAIKSILIKKYGIADSRITTIGHADQNPIASNDTDEGKAYNRRIHAIITGSKLTKVQITEEEYNSLKSKR